MQAESCSPAAPGCDSACGPGDSSWKAVPRLLERFPSGIRPLGNGHGVSSTHRDLSASVVWCGASFPPQEKVRGDVQESQKDEAGMGRHLAHPIHELPRCVRHPVQSLLLSVTPEDFWSRFWCPGSRQGSQICSQVPRLTHSGWKISVPHPNGSS